MKQQLGNMLKKRVGFLINGYLIVILADGSLYQIRNYQITFKRPVIKKFVNKPVLITGQQIPDCL